VCVCVRIRVRALDKRNNATRPISHLSRFLRASEFERFFRPENMARELAQMSNMPKKIMPNGASNAPKPPRLTPKRASGTRMYTISMRTPPTNKHIPTKSITRSSRLIPHTPSRLNETVRKVNNMFCLALIGARVCHKQLCPSSSIFSLTITVLSSR